MHEGTTDQEYKWKPLSELGFSRDMQFGMDAQVEDTTRLIRAIFVHDGIKFRL